MEQLACLDVFGRRLIYANSIWYDDEITRVSLGRMQCRPIAAERAMLEMAYTDGPRSTLGRRMLCLIGSMAKAAGLALTITSLARPDILLGGKHQKAPYLGLLEHLCESFIVRRSLSGRLVLLYLRAYTQYGVLRRG